MEKRKKKEKRETENAIVVSSPRAMNEEGFMGVNRRGGMNTEREREREKSERRSLRGRSEDEGRIDGNIAKER